MPSLRRLIGVSLCIVLAAANGAVVTDGAWAVQSISGHVVVNPLSAGLTLSAAEVDEGEDFEAFGQVGNAGSNPVLDVTLELRADDQLIVDGPTRSMATIGSGATHEETWNVCGLQPGSYLLLAAVNAETASGLALAVESPAVVVVIRPTGRSCAFPFAGFYSPIENPPILNLASAGSAIPVKFSIGGDQGLAIFASGYPASTQVACDSAAPLDAIEETAAPGSSGLTYDPATQVYTYVWKTKKPWAATCRELTVGLTDGSVHRATFKFRK